MEINHLLNLIPEAIPERESTVLEAERRSIVRSPLHPLAQEPAIANRNLQASPEQPSIPVRPGRPAKPIAERTAGSYAGVRKRMQRSYTREFKIEVLRWWLHHRIPQEADEPEPGVLRAPLLREVSARYLVSITTLHNWRAGQDAIVSGRKGERQNRSRVRSCR